MPDESILNLNTASIQQSAAITPYVDTTGSVITDQTITVTKDDTFDGNTISAGGIINVAPGAIITGNSFYDGATLSVASHVSNGGTGLYNNFYSGATCIIGSNGISMMDTVYDGASMTANGGIVMDTSISGGTVTLEADAYMQGGEAFSGGNLIANSGAVIDTLTVNSGGSATISSGASIASDDTTATATVTVAEGGTLTLDPSVGGVVNVTPGTGTNLIISVSDTATTGTPTTINGLSGADPSTPSAKLTLAGISANEILSTTTTTDQVTFTLTGGRTITLNIAGADQINFKDSTSDANGNIVFEACFLAGTMIDTGHSLCAVEDIQIGDFVMTYDWQSKQKKPRIVTWVGTKHVYVNPSLSDDLAGYPVRVLQGAIADNIPNKDLLITPEHSLFFEDKFIPVRMLVNGHSIYYDHSITSYDYYHIETEDHSVIYADGMMTESFLDTGNSKIFDETGNVTSLDVKPSKNWVEDAAAPLTVAREQVEPIYRQIEQRARNMAVPCQTLPVQLTDNADLHLITDNNQMIHNYIVKEDRILFTVPSNTTHVRIMSRVGRPSETMGAFIDDRRYLGVLIGEVKISQANRQEFVTLHHDTEHLNGWDVKEAVPCRWTNGNALLPVKALVNIKTPITISLQILAGGPYFIDIPEVTRKRA